MKKSTKLVDQNGYRYGEYIWITAYYSSHVSDLLSPNIQIHKYLCEYNFVEPATKVYIARHDLNEDSKCGKCANEFTGDVRHEYDFTTSRLRVAFKESSKVCQLRLIHAEDVDGNKQRKSSHGSFSLLYGVAQGADRDERWDTNTSEGRSGSIDSDSYLQIGLRTSGFYIGNASRLASEEQSREILDKLVRVLYSAGDAYHIVAHCGNCQEYCDGEAFATDLASPSRLGIHQEVSNYMWHWLLPSERKQVLHGLYWGVYLSPLHLDKLGGLALFRDQISKHYSGSNRVNMLLTDLGDGLFIRMTPSPLELSIEFPTLRYDSIAVWIYQRFLRAGLWGPLHLPIS